MIVDQQGEIMFFRPRPGYPPSLGAFGKGNFPRNRSTLGFHDLQQGKGQMDLGLADLGHTSQNLQTDRSLTPLSSTVSP